MQLLSNKANRHTLLSHQQYLLKVTFHLFFVHASYAFAPANREPQHCFASIGLQNESTGQHSCLSHHQFRRRGEGLVSDRDKIPRWPFVYYRTTAENRSRCL